MLMFMFALTVGMRYVTLDGLLCCHPLPNIATTIFHHLEAALDTIRREKERGFYPLTEFSTFFFLFCFSIPRIYLLFGG